jgi:hypothetical protein
LQELQELLMITLIEELVKMETSKLRIDGGYYEEDGVIFSSCESRTLKPSAWILQWFWMTLMKTTKLNESILFEISKTK